MNFKSSNKEISSYSEIPQRTTLVKYGEEVFRRENCIECHTFNIENERPGRYSLDGFGGTRSSEFVAGLLISPRDYFPGSKMPSYAHLSSSELNKKTLKSTFKNNESVSEPNMESEWNKLNTQAESFMEEINYRSHEEHTKSEAIALVAFLQFIPSSKAQKEINEILKENIKKEDEAQQLFLEKSDSIIRELAKNPNNISLGKKLYQNHCVMCHGENGEGLIGPNLTDDYWLYGGQIKDISDVIINGAPKGMPASKNVLTPTETGQLVSYLMEIKGTNYPGGKGAEGEKE